jgi:hypothetical protein
LGIAFGRKIVFVIFFLPVHSKLGYR